MQGKRCALRKRSGVAAVEFAVCLPLLLLLLAGAWEVGRMVEAQQLLANSVREGGRLASTGNKSLDDVKNYVAAYLNANGIASAKASDVTFQNLTNTAKTDPRDASQLDRLRVSVSISYDSIKWSTISRITNIKYLNASADWFSMKDLPITVNDTIPN